MVLGWHKLPEVLVVLVVVLVILDLWEQGIPPQLVHHKVTPVDLETRLAQPEKVAGAVEVLMQLVEPLLLLVI